jgi:hypothetical protein
MPRILRRTKLVEGYAALNLDGDVKLEGII